MKRIRTGVAAERIAGGMFSSMTEGWGDLFSLLPQRKGLVSSAVSDGSSCQSPSPLKVTTQRVMSVNFLNVDTF